MHKQYTIQGYEGSFHQQAALTYFNNEVTTIYCSNFTETFKKAANKNVDGAIIAIENSIAGSILPNYTLLQKSDLYIVGEIVLPIKQHLLANKGVPLAAIKEVHSHPMALLQCQDFLQQHNFKLVATEDTALSAKYIKQHNCKQIAAIASSLAAHLFDVTILAKNIHTEKNNSTRFLILEKQLLQHTDSANKASLYFETKHQEGSLAKVLTAIAKQGVNLSKLQSSPVTNNPYHYYFHIDMEFTNIAHLHKAINQIATLTAKHKLYGIYKSDNKTNVH